MHSYVHHDVPYSTQDIQATQCLSVDEGIKKMVCVCVCVCVCKHTTVALYTYVHTYSGILLSHKKEHNLDICNSTDGGRGFYAK